MAPSNTLTLTTAPSKSVPVASPATSASNSKDGKERLASVGVSSKWGIIMITANLVYGYLMVASHLPPDPRQNDWLLMQSPTPTFFVSLAYVISVTWLAPKVMAGRRAVPGLRPIMVAYNAFQVMFSAWLVYKIGMGGWFTSYSLRCQACDFSDDPQAITMLHASYWYYFSKFVDLLDTVFFVLNKKFEHISLLHVVHHSLMPVSMWYGVRYQPGGHSTFMGLLNSFVHVVMYLYYLLAAMGPRVRPFLWWKKYLTTLQMVQFVMVALHILQLAFTDCPGVPIRIVLWVFGNALMFLCLFANFYRNSYAGGRTRKEARGKELRVASATTTTAAPRARPGLALPSGVSRRNIPSGVADAALEMCEQVALQSHLGAI